MENFECKTLTTQRSLKYTYYVSPTSSSAQQAPALVFLHGFPDSAHLWSEVISELGDIPNQIVVPDCLGYAGTDKPEDTAMYEYKDQARDIMDILDKEEVKNGIVIGHDWGSALAQRVYLHHRERFCGVALLNTAYIVPSDQPFDLAAVNAFTSQIFGYPLYAYWDLFISPDASGIIDKNLDKMWEVLHGEPDDWMKQMFCVPDAMRKFLTNKDTIPLKSYAKLPGWKDRFMKQYERDGFASTLHMYKAAASNVHLRSEQAIPKDKTSIDVPLLFIACTKDFVCVPSLMQPAKDLGLVPKLKEVIVDCAHWSPMEKPDEVGEHLLDFIQNISS